MEAKIAIRRHVRNGVASYLWQATSTLNGRVVGKSGMCGTMARAAEIGAGELERAERDALTASLPSQPGSVG